MYFHTGAAPSCRDGDIRLTNSHSENEGRVEICVNGTWGKICPDNWSLTESATVCKQLGFSENGITKATVIDSFDEINSTC